MPSLNAILLKLKIIFAFSFLSFLTILLSHLEFFKEKLGLKLEILFYFNLIGFTVLFFTLFLFFYYVKKLSTRLKYLDTLGAGRW